MEKADEVLERARVEADAVLGAARHRADELLDGTHATAAATSAVAAARNAEDATLRADRGAADEALRIERAETARILARLLPAEREQTDEYLLAERVSADGAVANRDDFLGVVAHDLRDLLGGIVISAAVIGKLVGDDAHEGRVGAEIARIRRHAARATRLVGDLVDVVSIDAGRLASVSTPGDIAVLLREVADEFRPAASAKGIAFDIEQRGGTMLARFDHARLFQVFGNLISNSIKFSPRGTRITLCGEACGGEMQCSVRDEGPGIPAEQIEMVFERFAQVEPNDRRGLGLGLFIARQIVEAHHGRMWAHSTPGQGTSVLFTIPIGPT
ncbi:MAG TPA: HAMP domain-containing sensor histidine kinase [Vicinamibacterales bacterium]|nr:HAMP domain-containing sensor histidine kinase [Vicinamibacterales bacterium]